ncbi:MAG: hypothetical protein AAB297_02025, partial [Acidobacteriota bacterium]
LAAEALPSRQDVDGQARHLVLVGRGRPAEGRLPAPGLSAGLLEKGRLKEFYIELAEIMKRYLTARFGVDTFERTTSEILEALRLARLPVRGMTATAEFFGACDLVKFARHAPPPEETRVAVERAYRLIDETRAPDRAERPEGAAAGGGR